MDAALPEAVDLYNYDTDRDAFPGIVIAKGGSGPNEADGTKHQHWFTQEFPAAVVIQGQASVKLWTGAKDFNPTQSGKVSVYLRDCEGWDCLELGGATLTEPAWQRGSPSWVLKSFTLNIGTHTLAPGHTLELVLVVEPSSGDDIWFAYDTNAWKSRVTVTATSDVWPPLTAVSVRALADRISATLPRLLFA